MDGSVSLGRAQRKRFLEVYRRHSDPANRQRAHIVLLLADGRTWSDIASALYCSTRTMRARCGVSTDGTQFTAQSIPPASMDVPSPPGPRHRAAQSWRCEYAVPSATLIAIDL